MMRRATFLLVALIVVTAFGIFFVTPDGTGFLQRVDARLASPLAASNLHLSTLVSALVSPAAMMLAAVGLCIGLWNTSRSVLRNLVTIGAPALASLLAGAPAALVRRPPPGHVGELAAAHSMSFPSTSAAMAVALTAAALALADRPHPLPRWAVAAAWIAAAAPSVLRIMVGTAWPLDEIAGGALGVAAFAALHPIGPPRQRVPQQARPHRYTSAVAGLVVAALLVPAAASYISVLRSPGSASFDQRTVEWLRGHGFSPFVDRAESWWLWRHLPSPTETISTLPQPPVRLATTSPGSAGAIALTSLPAPILTAVQPALPGEGQWTVAAADGTGQPQLATTSFRPDTAHPSLVAGVAWISSANTRITLISGTKQPGGGAGPAGAHVPDSALPGLLAAFNSGYKMQDTPGGTLIEGRQGRAMVDGLATLAVGPDGRATVGEWGTDLTAAQGWVGLRQNLHLAVQNGRVVDGLAVNAGGRWGTVRNALPTWRSGLGVTANGDLVYVAGSNLTLGVLGDALVRAGAVTGMELDIHKGMVTFNLFTHQQSGVAGHKLLPNIPTSADRYLTTDWRDFVMVTSR